MLSFPAALTAVPTRQPLDGKINVSDTVGGLTCTVLGTHLMPPPPAKLTSGQEGLLFTLGGGRSVGRARTTGADLTLQLCPVPKAPNHIYFRVSHFKKHLPNSGLAFFSV